MKFKLFAITVSWILTSFFINTQSWAGTPTQYVQDMLEKVMSIQTDPKLKGAEFREQRRLAIKKIIKENFNFDKMAKQALGRFWQTLDEVHRAEFKAIFQDLFQDSYTRMVLDFLGKEDIRYTKEHVKQGKALVKTTIVRLNDEIPVDYSLAPVKKEWRIWDVNIDGVSIVKNYKRAFTRIIKRESFEALLQKMKLQQQAVIK